MAGTTTPARAPLGLATRLLVLGSVRTFQPVHGYFLRRELMSWDVDTWANVHPGSIYNALRTLASRGLLEEAATVPRGDRAPRTTYRLTAAGEQECLERLHATLSGEGDGTAFLVAVSFAHMLTREQVLECFRTRIAVLRGHVERAREVEAELLASPETPDRAVEVVRVIAARTVGELAWAEEYLARVSDGAYSFAGEPPDWRPTDRQVADALAAGVHRGPPPG